MLASRSRGASSSIIASVGASVRRLGLGTKSRSYVIANSAHQHPRNVAFFGSQSPIHHEGAASKCSSLVHSQPAFLSSHITQQIRGGDISCRTDCRSNSTSSASDNNSTPGDHQSSWRRAYLAVGSNLGDSYQNIAQALSSLEDKSNNTIRVLRTSYLRTTSPMYVTDQPAFLNGAVEIETTLSPMELLRAIKRAESDLGRDVSPNSTAIRNGPRPVDLDILLFDGYEVSNPDGTAADTLGDNEILPNSLMMQTDKLEIPHKMMAEREFVLSPMSDLEQGGVKNITHPVLNKTMSELLNSLLHKNSSTIGNVATTDSKDDRAFRVLPLPRGRQLIFNETIIMGILNITPDSFSDGGKYSNSVEDAATQAFQLEKDGAHIIDVGGESTRPGAEEVAVQEELGRVIPVIERIRQDSDVILSIDTRHAAVAKASIEAGADIVNDVSGGTHDPNMFACVGEMGVPMIIMHMRGNPKTMQSLTNYNDDATDGGNGVVAIVARELMQRSAAAEEAGVPRWLQVLDPGIGFAKDLEQNLSLMKGADTVRRACNNLPFLFGPSRKGFIGKIAGATEPKERDFGTIAACLASIQQCNNGNRGETCNILRVHNVKAVKQAVLIYDAIHNAK